MVGSRESLLAATVCLAGVVAAADRARAQQSLDEAVVEQLEEGCFRLFGDDGNIDDLTGELAAEICRGDGAAPPVSAASGGGAATPASAPGILQQQLREQLLAAAEQGGGPLAASADGASFEFGGRLSLFVLGRGGVVDKDPTKFEDGYDAALGGASVGGSYRIGSDLVAGLAFDYFHGDGNYDGGGNFDTDSYGVIAFGAWTDGPLTLQGSGGYARRYYERIRPVAFEQRDEESGPVTRSFSGRASGDYAGNAWFLEAAATRLWQWGRLTLTPWAALGWSRVDYDSYAEEGNSGLELRFDDDQEISVLSTLGIGAATVVSAGPVALVPSLDVSWLHEFEKDRRTVEVSFVDDTRPKTFTYSTETPDRNFGLLRAGLTAVLPNGLRPFLQLETLFENRSYASYLVTIGLSFEL